MADQRAEQLVRVLQVTADKLSDPKLDLSLDEIDRAQAAAKKVYDSGIVRLLAKSIEVRAVDAVGAGA